MSTNEWQCGVYTQNQVLSAIKKNEIIFFFAGKHAPGDHYIKQSEPDLKRQILH